MAYVILSLNKAGLVWYFVGKVNCRAHVDARGNCAVALKFILAVVSNPQGGGYSAPVKKLRICSSDTWSGMSASTLCTDQNKILN